MTLQWWNDLWLNEGFASYVEYLGADSAEPAWNIVSDEASGQGVQARGAGGGCGQGVQAPPHTPLHPWGLPLLPGGCEQS